MKICLLPFLIATLQAQWIHLPTPGIPRTANGKPNLTAPVARTADGKPDLSGIWRIGMGAPGYVVNLAADLKPGDVQPWADALYRKRLANLGRDDPWTVDCLPLGPRHITNGGLARIVQTPNEIVMLYEDLAYRQIFLDGRALPQDPNPTWMGYSVGRWDGDTLIVETTGFNDRSWIDMGGHPHTEALRITERFHRRDLGHMDLSVTIDDPKAYAKPWTIRTQVGLAADTELLESVCNENERDRSHLVGRTAEEQKVTVAPSILAQYAGTYDTISATDAVVSEPLFVVTFEDNQLWLDMGGKGKKLPLVPLSETTFSPRLLGTWEFVKDDQGTVIELRAHSTEGVMRAKRRR